MIKCSNSKCVNFVAVHGLCKSCQATTMTPAPLSDMELARLRLETAGRTSSPLYDSHLIGRLIDTIDALKSPTPAPAASLSGVDREELARAIGMAKLRLAILSHTNPEVSAIAAKMPNLDFDNVWRKNVSYIQEDSLAAADAAIAYFLSHFATERKSPWRPTDVDWKAIAKIKARQETRLQYHDRTNTTIDPRTMDCDLLLKIIDRPAPQPPAEGQ